MRSGSRNEQVCAHQRAITGEAVRSWVYVVEAERGLKIGFTTDPLARLNTLERQFGYLYTWALVPGTRDDERRLHEKYADLRIEGEWFSWSDDLIAACEAGTLLGRSGLCTFSRPAWYTYDRRGG